jgi:hypothetical protein
MTPDVLRRSVPYDPAPQRGRPWDRFAARVLAASLDRQLAAGHPPQSSQALAIRLRLVASPAGRRELAEHWIHVMDLTARPPAPLPARGPLCRGAVAEGDVREMIAILAGDLPIAARGAAVASWLLSDGTGPLHNHRSSLQLSAAVRQVTRQIGSFTDTPPDRAAPHNAECHR